MLDASPDAINYLGVVGQVLDYLKQKDEARAKGQFAHVTSLVQEDEILKRNYEIVAEAKDKVPTEEIEAVREELKTKWDPAHHERIDSIIDRPAKSQQRRGFSR